MLHSYLLITAIKQHLFISSKGIEPSMSLMMSKSQRPKVQIETTLRTSRQNVKHLTIHHLRSPRINPRQLNCFQKIQGKNSSFISMELHSSFSRSPEEKSSSKRIKRSNFMRIFRGNKSDRGVYEAKAKKLNIINEKQLVKLKQMMKSISSTPNHNHQKDKAQFANTFLKNTDNTELFQNNNIGILLQKNDPAILLLRQSLNRSRYEKSNLQSKFVHSGSRKRQILLRTSQNLDKKIKKPQSSRNLTLTDWITANSLE